MKDGGPTVCPGTDKRLKGRWCPGGRSFAGTPDISKGHEFVFEIQADPVGASRHLLIAGVEGK